MLPQLLFLTGMKDIQDFLNRTTSSKILENSVGLSFESLFTSLGFSLIFCILQLLLFSVLRVQFKTFYQPLCYLVPQKYKVSAPENTFFGWFKSISKRIMSRGDFKRRMLYGLDSYFLLKFFDRLLTFFVGLAIINIPVLVPANYFGNSAPVRTLDSLSISNVSNRKLQTYILHFCVALFAVGWFIYNLNFELEQVVRLRQGHILKVIHKDKNNFDYFSIVLISNIPRTFRSKDKIHSLFNSIPDGVKNIWSIYDYRDLNKLVNRYQTVIHQLEKFELKLISKEISSCKCYEDKLVLPKSKSSIDISEKSRQFYTMYEPYKLLEGVCIPNIISNKISSYEYYKNELKMLSEIIKGKQAEMLLMDQNKKITKSCFIRFNSPRGAYCARQLLLCNNTNAFIFGTNFNEIDPRSIIWRNVIDDMNKSYVKKSAKKLILTITSVLIIIVWMLPVAIVGSLSQLTYLTVLIPATNWLNSLPHHLKDFLSSIIPTIMMTFLTGIALFIFKWMTSKMHHKAESDCQLNLSHWVFLFLFFHLFIVISLSSGAVVVLERLVTEPTSIPAMVAQDFPRASNFFYSFFILKGLTLFGNTLLQFSYFTYFQFMINWVDKTPREKSQRKLRLLLKPDWGIIYSTFSVYASIGIVYSVISPLVTLCCLANFVLDLAAYTYSLNYLHYFKNYNDTYGNLYALSLRQISAGVYSLLIYLIGLFFLVRDENGERKCLVLGILMIGVLSLTIYYHFQLNKKYNKLLKSIPMNSFDLLASNQSEKETEDYKIDLRLKYLHPCFSFNPFSQTIWIPRDRFGISQTEIGFLEKDLKLPVSDTGCDISDRGLVTVHSPPPDYTW